MYGVYQTRLRGEPSHHKCSIEMSSCPEFSWVQNVQIYTNVHPGRLTWNLKMDLWKCGGGSGWQQNTNTCGDLAPGHPASACFVPRHNGSWMA